MVVQDADVPVPALVAGTPPPANNSQGQMNEVFSDDAMHLSSSVRGEILNERLDHLSWKWTSSRVSNVSDLCHGLYICSNRRRSSLYSWQASAPSSHK